MSQLTIPKRIAQVWITIKDSEIPRKWDVGRFSINQQLPDWDYHVYREDEIEQLVNKIDPSFMSTYNSFPYGIQKADAARAFILYEYGGVYMDMDYQVLNSEFESLFEGAPGYPHLYLVPSGNIPSYFTNSFMASTPGHPFWLQYINRMRVPNPWYMIGKHFEVQNATGPLALTDVARKTHHKITILPSKKITPCSVCDMSCDIEVAYLRQLEGSSWIGFDTYIYIKIMCYHRPIIFWVVVIAFIIVIFFILWLIYYLFIR